jgi:shikimate kinase
MNIYFIGMMGSGKTTVARAASQRYGTQFVDTDQLIVKKTGVPVATIFELEGEAGFRKRESHCLSLIAGQDNQFIATGGGLPTVADNVLLMRSNGKVMYLEVKPDVLWGRLKRDRSRPLLKTENPKQTLFDLIERRSGIYADAADITINVSDLSLSQVLSTLEPTLKHWLAESSTTAR